MTVDHASVFIDNPYWDKSLAFVAMTRHRESLQLYVNQEQIADISALSKTLTRSVNKGNVIDWPVDYAMRLGFDVEKKIENVFNALSTVVEKCIEFTKKIITPSLQEFQQKEASWQQLRSTHPILTSYETLLQQAKTATGFKKERIEKCIQAAATSITQNKSLMGELKQALPKVALKIDARASHQRSLEQEHDV